LCWGPKSYLNHLLECLATSQRKWYLDSDCSRHMTEDTSMFIDFTRKERGFVSYGDNNQGKILGKGTVGNPSTTTIKDAMLVDELKHNLFSISQFCENGFTITFNTQCCIIKHNDDKDVMFKGLRVNNVYVLDLDDVSSSGVKCLIAKNEDSWLWNRRISHVHFDLLNKIVSKDLVVGLPKIKFENDRLCDACQKGEQTRVSFKPKKFVSTSKPLELLHLDLFGPSGTRSLASNYYGFVIVDDFSRFTWTLFLSSKDDTFDAFIKFANIIQNQISLKIISLRSDHGAEFVNHRFEDYSDEFGISHNFSCPRTPQQNGVVERKNRVLEELARTMINEMKLPKCFWADAINTACHVLNRVIIRSILDKTPYKLLKGRKPNLSHLRVFGCKCFVSNDGKDKLGKFDAKADDGIFLGYSYNSKAYRVFNKWTLTVEESIHVAFDETPPQEVGKGTFGFDIAGIDTEEIVKDDV